MQDDKKLDLVLERFYNRFNTFNTKVLEELGNAIKQFDGVSTSQAYEIAQKLKYGYDLDNLLNELSKISGKSIQDVDELFDKVAEENVNFAETYYKAKNKEFINYEDNKQLQNLVDAIKAETNGTFKNLSKSQNIGFTLKDNQGNITYKPIKEVYNNFDYSNSELSKLKNYIISRNIWIVGGDGWAYDIGFSGIDHILSSNQNVRILVLDTEVYSNTGGQSSKSSNRGSIAKFTANGKETSKKDLARIAMCYKNTYVAQVSLANMNAVIKAFTEADKHNGPAIIIAYSHCINHGIKSGMESAIEEQKLAVNSGYFPIFRYDGDTFTMDHKEPDFSLLDKFIDNETRFQALKIVNKEKAEVLFTQLKEDAKERYEYYRKLVN